MKLKIKTLLNILEASDKPLSARQITSKLGLPRSKTAQVQDELMELEKRGKVKRKVNKFTGVPESEKPSQRDQRRDKSKRYNAKNKEFKDSKPREPKDSKPNDPPRDSRRNFRQRPQKSSSGFGSHVTGIFSRNRRGFGFVAISRDEPDIFIPQGHQGNALDGDEVEVVVVKQQGDRTRGKIVNVVKRRKSQFIGKLMRGTRHTLVLPLSDHLQLPPVIISPEDDLTHIPAESLVEVEILDASENSKDVYGRIIAELTENTEDEVAEKSILIEQGIRTNFSKEVLEHAEQLPSRVVYDEKSGRVDQRDLGYVTIDGKTARDFDDAVFAERVKGGRYRLYVAIADVAHYVQFRDVIDQEAYTRGTSVYLSTHAIPMLPEKLSNDLCSLKPNVNRFTLTCEMEIDSEGHVQKYSIYEGLIRSQARLTYDAVEKLFQKKPTTIKDPQLIKNLELLKELAEILGRKREERGAINFSFPEYVAKFNKQEEVVGFQKTYQSSSMKLIEQCMLEANETVAKHCVQHKLPALYRVHSEPDLQKLKKLRRTFAHFQVSTNPAKLHDSRQFNRVLEQIEGHPYGQQLQLQLLKSMDLACYLPHNEGHFGLSAEFYAHFTSPIRRYPDLLVHRSLKRQLQKKTGKFPKPIDSRAAEYLSQQERRAETAEYQSRALLKVTYMQQFLGEEFKARVTGTASDRVIVEFEKQALEWSIPLDCFEDDRYRYNATNLALEGKHSGRLIRLGARMVLQLARVDCLQREMEFVFIKWLK